MRRIKIAQIGCSETTHGSSILPSMLRQSDIFEVVGLADVDVHTRPLHPSFTESGVPMMSVEELFAIPGLEAIAVECDEALQTKYAIMAAERGFPILLEKPGSESDEDFDRLIDIIEEKNLPFQMNYMYRFNSAVRYALEKVKNGELGEIYSVEAQMNCYEPVNYREWCGNFKGGMLYYLGCHLVDLIYQIQGEPEEILPLSTCTQPGIVNANDLGFAVFKYKNGISFAKVCGLEVGGAMRRQLVICGTKGTIEIRPIEHPVEVEGYEVPKDTCYLVETYQDQTPGAPIRDWALDGDHKQFEPKNRYDEMTAFFAAMVRGDAVNPYTPDYERKMHKLFIRACGLEAK